MSAQVVVANAGPLMAFSKLNILHLLKALYGEIQFTRAVYDEVVVEGMRRGHEDAHTLHRYLDQEGWQAVVVVTAPQGVVVGLLGRQRLDDKVKIIGHQSPPICQLSAISVSSMFVPGSRAIYAIC